MIRFTKKKKVALATAILVLVGGGTAVAYWTAGGSGTGTVATGANVPITVNQTSSMSPIVPGGAAQTLSGNFGNSNAGPVYVATVTASIGSVTKAVGAPAGLCDATDYTLSTPTMTVNAQVPSGAAQGTWTGATIAFNNKPAANQDGCKGATVALTYTAS